MVCLRCKILVAAQLDELSISHGHVELGEVNVDDHIQTDKLDFLRAALVKFGLELMDDKKSVLIRKIKSIISELIHCSDEPLKIKFSSYLSETLHIDYKYLANLFFEVQGATIGNFIIAHKIERVKELLVYEKFNLTKISYIMHYSSVAQLSTQFKNVTGLTPTHFKQLKDNRRATLNKI